MIAEPPDGLAQLEEPRSLDWPIIRADLGRGEAAKPKHLILGKTDAGPGMAVPVPKICQARERTYMSRTGSRECIGLLLSDQYLRLVYSECFPVYASLVFLGRHLRTQRFGAQRDHESLNRAGRIFFFCSQALSIWSISQERNPSSYFEKRAKLRAERTLHMTPNLRTDGPFAEEVGRADRHPTGSRCQCDLRF